MACPYTAAKKVVTEDLPTAVVAVGLEGFAKHMVRSFFRSSFDVSIRKTSFFWQEWDMAHTILGGVIVGASTFLGGKGRTANAVKKEKYATEKLYFHLGVLSVATMAGLYAGGLFLKSKKK